MVRRVSATSNSIALKKRNIRNSNITNGPGSTATAGSARKGHLVPAVVSSNTHIKHHSNPIEHWSSPSNRRPLHTIPKRQLLCYRRRNYRWDRYDAKEQLTLASTVMKDVAGDDLWAPTWHFTNSIQDGVRQSRSIKYLVDETGRLVKRVLHKNVLFWFVVEESSSGRIHAHAGFVCTKAESLALESALKERFCKGLEDKLWGHNKPVDVRLMWGPEGWAGYCSKDFRRFSRNVGVKKPYYISRPLKELVKSELAKDNVETA
jgi:hypothetical protein